MENLNTPNRINFMLEPYSAKINQILGYASEVLKLGKIHSLPSRT